MAGSTGEQQWSIEKAGWF